MGDVTLWAGSRSREEDHITAKLGRKNPWGAKSARKRIIT